MRISKPHSALLNCKGNDVNFFVKTSSLLPFPLPRTQKLLQKGRFRLLVDETLSSPEAMFETESTRTLYSIAVGKRRPAIGGDERASSIGISKTLRSLPSVAALENDPFQINPCKLLCRVCRSHFISATTLAGTFRDSSDETPKEDPKEEEEEQMERIRVVMAEERRLREEEQNKKAVCGRRGLRLMQ
ncbi:hypothetical protein M427DRAFT_264615 [Gonapodya prolifera JEL478]|uniref:Uncharacterized protein n=1 Tax=Gonapodya prolifera (strain JEL478) TaxID=1344416 RepID=A0A139AL04_GONPJ|nr:hypothetical protein M427DRAFT_264615 [Gonapodya prolifera JEL478]|eukprot:KXS17173.1 hypothetical protein M427DRAFT_264615 [Gonapodya prolifera JEL478]